MRRYIYTSTKDGIWLALALQLFVLPILFLLFTFSAKASPLSDCIATCNENRDSCMSDDGARPARVVCVRALNACTNQCRQNHPESTPAPQLQSLSPTWGWSGDSLRIQGNNIFNPDLAVTIGGQPASIISSNRASISRSWDIVDIQVPVLRGDTRGPGQYPIVVATGGKTFQYTFAYSPVIIGEDHREIPSRGPFLASGYVGATVEFNRETGQATARTSANVYNGPFDSLPYTVAAMFFDINGRPIGSLETREFTAKEFNFNGQPGYFEADWTDAIRPASSLNTAFTNQIRYAVVHISTNEKQDVEAQVLNIMNFGKTMAEAITFFKGS